jgi:SET domain-containing protein 6
LVGTLNGVLVCKPEQQLISLQALTAIILDESLRQDSKWAPYLAILPQELNNLVFWSAPELSELQASKVVSKIGKSDAEEMFSKFITPLGLAHCNSEECHRVASIIMSYAFDIPETTTKDNEKVEDDEDLVSDEEEDENTVLSMVPLADMLYVYSKQSFRYIVLEGPLRSGERVSRFYLHWKFVLTFIGRNADADRNNARLCCDNEDLEMRTIKPITKGDA